MGKARYAMEMRTVGLDHVVLPRIRRFYENRVCTGFQCGIDIAAHAVTDHPCAGRIGDTVPAERLAERVRVLALADAHTLLVHDVDDTGATDAGELVLELAALRVDDGGGYGYEAL